MKDKQHAGRPTIPNENIAFIQLMLQMDWRWMVQELAAEARVSHITMLPFLEDILKMLKIASHWVSHHLSDEQKLHCYKLANLLHCIVMMDERGHGPIIPN